MKKSISVGIALAALTFCAILPSDAQEQKPRGGMAPAVKPTATPITLTGEVVDAWCYSSKVMGEGHGEEHKNCAITCIHGGVSIGIVDEKTGDLYIAAKSRAYTGCQEQLFPFVAKRVTIQGWTATRGGCKVLKISSVKLAEPAKQ